MAAKNTKSTKGSSPKELFVKVMVVLSILGNIFFITSAIAIGVFLNSNSSDFYILNFAFSRKGINYDGPGGCLKMSKEMIDKGMIGKGMLEGSNAYLDSKGRLTSSDGKVQCIVQITPQEADAIQQKLDSQNMLPPKQ